MSSRSRPISSISIGGSANRRREAAEKRKRFLKPDMSFHRLVVCAVVCSLVIGFLLTRGEAAVDSKSQRPNVLWLTCEDMGPHLGAYGDRYSTTPNLDRFAAQGVRFLNAWSNAPVCAPA